MWLEGESEQVPRGAGKGFMGVGSGRKEGGVVFAALMPHAPILIPDVANDELKWVTDTVAALKTTADRLIRRRPHAVVVVSPHSPRKFGAFGLWSCERLIGNFSAFGAVHSALDLPNDSNLAAEIKKQARGAGLQTWDIPGAPLDYGAMVPLWYLAQAGWNGPTVVLGLNYPGEEGLPELGIAIARAAARLKLRLAIVASGDMSHRLALCAPGGYEPRASIFDKELIHVLADGAYAGLKNFDHELQQVAGEDALDSTLIALAAANWQTKGHEVLSYESPFGVGYGVAVLLDADTPVQPREDVRRGV